MIAPSYKFIKQDGVDSPDLVYFHLGDADKTGVLGKKELFSNNYSQPSAAVMIHSGGDEKPVWKMTQIPADSFKGLETLLPDYFKEISEQAFTALEETLEAGDIEVIKNFN